MNIDEAIDDLYTILGQHNGEYMDYSSYSNAVDNLNIISNFVAGTRWIPVSERLPIENGKYLIYVSAHTTEDSVQREEITSAIWSDKRWHYGHTWMPRQNPVTHWMPLPEPPQEVK